MARDVINIRVELDRETDLRLRKWSAETGRSKRRHAAVLLRRAAVKWDEKQQHQQQVRP